MYKITLVFLLLTHLSGFSQDKRVGNNATKDSLLKLAEQNSTEFNFKHALILYRLVIKIDSTNPEIWSKAGYTAYRIGDYSTASLFFEEGLAKDSLHRKCLNYMGLLSTKRGRYKEASYYYKKLSRQNPSNTFYLRKLGEINISMDRDSIAALFYKKAYKLNRTDLASLYGLCKSNYRLERYKKVDSLCRQYLKIDSNELVIRKYALKTNYRLNDYDDAVVNGEFLINENDSSIIVLKLYGISLYNVNRYKQADRIFEELKAKENTDHTIFYFDGLCKMELGRYKLAESSIRKSIQLAISKNINRYYVQLGMLFEDKMKYSKAIETYREGFEVTNDNELLFHLARNYDLFYKDKKPALKHYKAYLESTNSESSMYTEYARKRLPVLREIIHFSGK